MKILKRITLAIRWLNRKIIGNYRRGGLAGAYHWIRCHTWHRYHIVNLSGEADYGWGWIDRDHAILISSFRLLRDFVELEAPGIGLNDSVESYIGNSQDPTDLIYAKSIIAKNLEIRQLYTWWVTDRPAAHKAFDQAGSYDPAVEKSLYELDQSMLHRLVDIRQHLWT